MDLIVAPDGEQDELIQLTGDIDDMERILYAAYVKLTEIRPAADLTTSVYYAHRKTIELRRLHAKSLRSPKKS